MCGISGWYSWGDRRPTAHTIKGLLLANQERGISATGMAWLDGDSIVCRKGQGPADDFIANTPDEVFEQAALSPRGLLHARATTKGSEKANENNHPVVGLDWLVVHNGTVTNDDDLWGYYTEKEAVERFAEVDTSVIPLMLSRGATIEESIKKLTSLSGSATIAAWSEKDHDRMLLGRFGHNDLHMFYDAGTNVLYWSSAPSASYVMRGIFMGKHKFLTLSRLANQHVLLLSPEGLEATRVFKLSQRPFHAARKRGPRNDGTTRSAPGFTLPQVPAVTPSPTRESGGVLPVLSVAGWKEILGNDQKKTLAASKDFIRVMYKPPADALMVSTSWKPIDPEPGKPSPDSNVFTKVWWDLDRLWTVLDESKVVSQITKESAYGRWTFSQNPHRLSFKGHKRIKAWWDRLYRTRFEFPLEVEADGRTVLCHHMAWEHYDINLQKLDKSSISWLGFLCPWCGVWMSSTKVQQMKHRCEFCGVQSRMEPAQGGSDGNA